MRSKNILLSVVCMLCFLMTFSLHANATELETSSLHIADSETAEHIIEETVAVEGVQTEASGMIISSNDSDLTVMEGETATWKFSILPDGNIIMWYYIELYDSSNKKVAYVSDSVTNYYNKSMLSLSISVDTADLNLEPGKYKIKYWLNTQSYAFTKEFVVTADICKGNHNFVQNSIETEATCVQEGSAYMVCTNCGESKYESIPMTGHNWNTGEVTTEPTDYTNGVRTITCTTCGITKTESIPALATAPAKPYKIANVVSGVHVYWNAVEGAQKYGLWRSETGKEGTYKWVANPTVPHFTDIKVTSGKTYYYKVTVFHVDYNVHSDKSEAIGVTYVSTPDITSRINKAAGIQLGWNKINGATGYAIYRMPYGGTTWTRIATINNSSTLTWTDEAVKANNGTVYKYTIRALAGSNNNTLSGCRATGRTMVRLASRTMTGAVKTSATSIKCNWTTSSAVSGYEVRFMIGSNVYETYTIGNYKTGTKTFTGLTAGQTYKIQVRSYKKVDGVGSFYSAWSTAKTVTL